MRALLKMMIFGLTVFCVVSSLVLRAEAAVTQISIKIPDGLSGVNMRTRNLTDGSILFTTISFGYGATYFPLYADDGGIAAATGFCAILGKTLVTRPTYSTGTIKISSITIDSRTGVYRWMTGYSSVTSVTCR